MYNLSIIIPHYNSVNTLEKLLKSIPEKNDIQVIIIDDKSNKQIKELTSLVNKYGSKDINFVQNTTTEKGAGVCRNIGLNKARGKWILFADADDYFLDTMYEVVSSYFSSNSEVIYFAPTSLEAETCRLSDRHIQYKNLVDNYIKNKNTKNENRLRFTFYVPWSKLISKDFIVENNIQFDKVIASNDVMFSTKVGYYATDIAASEKTIYCSLRHKGSLTTQISEQVYDSRLKVWIKYYNFLRKKLDENRFEELGIKNSGRGYLMAAINYNFSFKKIIKVYIKLKKNKMPIFDIKLFNPFHLIRSFNNICRRYTHNREYYTKN